MKRIKMPLLARIIIAILLGVIFGNFFNEAAVRAFLTFNGIFSQFLGFMIPLIIIGLVTPAIADIGHGAGKLLLATVGIAFADTILAGLLAYGTGSALFPNMIANSAHVAVDKAEELKPFFEIKIPAMVDVMSALVFSFIAGLGIAHKGSRTMKNIFQEFKEIVSGVIAKVIIPLLPLYIFGIFLGMTFSGEAYHILLVFAQIILVILVLHIVILLYEYLLAGGLSHKNPFKLLLNMLPAYFTALGTSSSAATIPVTLKQTLKNGVTDGIAGFTIPLCATIHLSGSMMKITCCALTICLINGILPVAEQGTAGGGHLCADLVRAPGQQPALDEREPPAALQRAVFRRGGFCAWLRLFRHVDLVFYRVLEQIPIQPSFGGLRPSADDAEIGLIDLTVADLIVQDAQRLGVFRRDDDAAGVAVDAVAERGGEGVFGLRVPFAALTQVGLNV